MSAFDRFVRVVPLGPVSVPRLTTFLDRPGGPGWHDGRSGVWTEVWPYGWVAGEVDIDRGRARPDRAAARRRRHGVVYLAVAEGSGDRVAVKPIARSTAEPHR